ncbi:MAG: NHL repeat-containing protein [candidate division KSB1 bacterium]|nr:NHL repeat-containing protein [candidate division KSB1 bacterium]MDZ7288155.1 NHL repeat-containing protein [candidate division KSB1 bacterium]MDZ7300332.1 NHL repeat-containing protein [candidate division KSB1 bacterium]MDZ7306145.1 NHL repeat-containing protein [candidate division KSB1 bacterium]MDZ7351332.1 NHL repeat-containing protein [candidate division KSB1 bacterium]
MRFGIFLFLFVTVFANTAAQPVQANFLGSLLGDTLNTRPLAQPAAIALDPEGNLYVADTGNQRVVKCDPEGRWLREVGGFGFDAGQFDRPVDVWAGNGLDVIVADYNNHRLQRFDRDLNFIAAYSSEAGQEQSLQFGYPAAVALSPQGELLVADHEFNRLLRFDAFGRPRASFGDFNWGEGGLVRPAKIMISSRGEIFVSDSVRHAIMIYDAYGNFLDLLGAGLLDRPCGVAEWQGLVLVADRGHQRIAGFRRSGELVIEFGRADSTTPGLRAPVALAVRPTLPSAGTQAAVARAYVLDAGRLAVLVYALTRKSN